MSDKYIGLYGGYCNCLLSIAFGKYLESKGESVKYVDYKVQHEPCIYKKLADLGVELDYTYNNDFIDASWKSVKEHLRLMDTGKAVVRAFHPEHLSYLGMDHDYTDECVGIHIRRGDYLKPSVQHKYFANDLCKTKYFENVADIVNELDLPIKIFSDDIDAIPDNIKQLFPTATYICNNTLDDFNALSNCKYIVCYSSTFSGCAAALNKNGIIYYPKGMLAHFTRDNWVPVDIK